MSTHAMIGLEAADGSIRSIYVHSDGYLEHTGKVLQEAYPLRSDVQALIALGDLSFLGRFIDRDATRNEIEKRDETIAYHRDRGESLAATRADSYISRDEFLLASAHSSYVYLMTKDDSWLYVNNEKTSWQNKRAEWQELR